MWKKKDLHFDCLMSFIFNNPFFIFWILLCFNVEDSLFLNISNTKIQS